MRYLAYSGLILLLILSSGCGGSKVTVIKTSPPEKKLIIKSAPSREDIKKSALHLAKAKKFYNKGKYKQVQDHCEKAIAYDHSNWEAHYYLGLAMQKRREYAGSIEALKAGLKLGPDNKFVKSDIHFNIGINFEQLGMSERARSEYQQALAYNSANQSARKGLNRIKVKKTLKNWNKKNRIEYDG